MAACPQFQQIYMNTVDRNDDIYFNCWVRTRLLLLLSLLLRARVDTQGTNFGMIH